MEEIRINDYIRTIDGFFGKVVNINDYREPSMRYAVEVGENAEDLLFIGDNHIKKSSDDIIDIIEINDIVEIQDEWIHIKNEEQLVFLKKQHQNLKNNEIGIVSHEIMNNAKFKI